MSSIETEQQSTAQESFLKVKKELALLKKALEKKEAAAKAKAQEQTPLHGEQALFIERTEKKKKDTTHEAQDSFDTTPGDHVLVEL